MLQRDLLHLASLLVEVQRVWSQRFLLPRSWEGLSVDNSQEAQTGMEQLFQGLPPVWVLPCPHSLESMEQTQWQTQRMHS